MTRRSVINSSSLALLLLISSFCTCDQWLMQGDFIPPDEASRLNLIIETTNSTTSVTSSLRLIVKSSPNHRINCVLAASLNMNGNVRLIDGGVGYNNVTLDYATLFGKPDQLFVQIESYTDDRVSVSDNLAENSKVTILYDLFRDWARGNVKADDDDVDVKGDAVDDNNHDDENNTVGGTSSSVDIDG